MLNLSVSRRLSNCCFLEISFGNITVLADFKISIITKLVECCSTDNHLFCLAVEEGMAKGFRHLVITLDSMVGHTDFLHRHLFLHSLWEGDKTFEEEIRDRCRSCRRRDSRRCRR